LPPQRFPQIAIAAILTGARCDAENLPWAALRYQHTATRAALIERYKPSMANKTIALRGVLKESWRLGDMAAEDYHRAADVPTIKAQTLPGGRALASGEIAALMSPVIVTVLPPAPAMQH
jgi:integrase/recombinase XerD